MLDTLELTANIVRAAQSIPELLAALGNDPGKFYAYDNITVPAWNVFDAVKDMHPPCCMLAYLGTNLGRRGDIQAWMHAYSIFISTDLSIKTSPGIVSAPTMFRLLVDGYPLVPDSDGGVAPVRSPVRFLDSELHVLVDPLTEMGLDRAQMPDGTEYWMVRMTFVEKGG